MPPNYGPFCLVYITVVTYNSTAVSSLRFYCISFLYLCRELLRDLRRVGVSGGTFSERHHNKLLKKLLLCELDQVSL